MATLQPAWRLVVARDGMVFWQQGENRCAEPVGRITKRSRRINPWYVETIGLRRPWFGIARTQSAALRRLLNVLETPEEIAMRAAD